MSDPRTPTQNPALPEPRLHDGLVSLRPLHPADAALMAATSTDDDYVAWGPLRGPLDEARALALVEEWEAGRRAGAKAAAAVLGPEKEPFVGSAMLQACEGGEAELAYWIRPEARGRGYATRALLLMAAWAEALGFRRLRLDLELDNRASRRVAEKAGFRCERTEECQIRRKRTPCEIWVRSSPLLLPPAGYQIRAPRMADLDVVVAVLRAADVEDTGEPDTGRASVLAEWEGLPHFDLSQDAWLMYAETGEAVAYADEWDERPHEWLLGHFAVLPGHQDRGLDDYLMGLIERRARAHAARAPNGTSKLGVYCVSTDRRKTRLYRSRGFSHIRSFARLSRDLTEALPPPVWPAGILVRPLRRGRDETAVHAALEDAFSEHFREERLPLEDWERLIFADHNLDPDLWFVAWDGSRVAGTALAFSLQEPRYGYIDRLGVRAEWRRRGLGEALLRQCFIALRERGQVRAVLGVDIDNVTGAQRLYERVGMRPERVTEFFEKEVGVLG